MYIYSKNVANQTLTFLRSPFTNSSLEIFQHLCSEGNKFQMIGSKHLNELGSFQTVYSLSIWNSLFLWHLSEFSRLINKSLKIVSDRFLKTLNISIANVWILQWCTENDSYFPKIHQRANHSYYRLVVMPSHVNGWFCYWSLYCKIS